MTFSLSTETFNTSSLCPHVERFLWCFVLSASTGWCFSTAQLLLKTNSHIFNLLTTIWSVTTHPGLGLEFNFFLTHHNKYGNIQKLQVVTLQVLSRLLQAFPLGVPDNKGGCSLNPNLYLSLRLSVLIGWKLPSFLFLHEVAACAPYDIFT